MTSPHPQWSQSLSLGGLFKHICLCLLWLPDEPHLALATFIHLPQNLPLLSHKIAPGHMLVKTLILLQGFAWVPLPSDAKYTLTLIFVYMLSSHGKGGAVAGEGGQSAVRTEGVSSVSLPATLGTNTAAQGRWPGTRSAPLV